jgi:hypothetical protein
MDARVVKKLDQYYASHVYFSRLDRQIVKLLNFRDCYLSYCEALHST